MAISTAAIKNNDIFTVITKLVVPASGSRNLVIDFSGDRAFSLVSASIQVIGSIVEITGYEPASLTTAGTPVNIWHINRKYPDSANFSAAIDCTFVEDPNRISHNAFAGESNTGTGSHSAEHLSTNNVEDKHQDLFIQGNFLVFKIEDLEASESNIIMTVVIEETMV